MMIAAIFAFFVRFPVIPIMLLLSGIAVTLTGLTIKFKPLAICGILGALTFMLPFIFKGNEQVLVYALSIIVMMIIPGHILQFLSRKNHV